MDTHPKVTLGSPEGQRVAVARGRDCHKHCSPPKKAVVHNESGFMVQG